MGHWDQDGKNVGQMSLFDLKAEAGADWKKQNKIYFQVLLAVLGPRLCPKQNSDSETYI